MFFKNDFFNFQHSNPNAPFKQLGFDVVAFDASMELVKLASSKINHKILHMKIEDMDWQEEFDGIWAMASLLHLKREEIEYNIQKILTA